MHNRIMLKAVMLVATLVARMPGSEGGLLGGEVVRW